MKKLNYFIMLVAATFLNASMAVAADPSPTPPMDTEKMVQMHEKMSKAHKEAGECLKAGKSHQECHQIIMKAHEESGMGMGMGMGMGKGMGPCKCKGKDCKNCKDCKDCKCPGMKNCPHAGKKK